MIKYGKTEIKKIAALLDQEWDSAEQAADALLAEAVAIVEARGKFTVVGQLRYSRFEGGYVDHSDAAASKVCLGLYSSRAEADKAAERLVFSSTTNESFLAWVIEVDYRTPAEVFTARKEMHRLREIAERKVKAA